MADRNQDDLQRRWKMSTIPLTPRLSDALRPRMRDQSCNGFILQPQTHSVLALFIDPDPYLLSRSIYD